MPYPLETFHQPTLKSCPGCRRVLSVLSHFDTCDRCSFVAAIGDRDPAALGGRGGNIQTWEGPPAEPGPAPRRFLVTSRVGLLLTAWPEMADAIKDHLADPEALQVRTMAGVAFSSIAIPPQFGPPASVRLWSVRAEDGSGTITTLLSHSAADGDKIRHVSQPPPPPPKADPEDEPHSIGGNFQDALIQART
jgi:hypothetical protein